MEKVTNKSTRTTRAILAMALVLITMVSMISMPASAAFYGAYAGSSRYLNTYTSAPVKAGDTIRLWSYTGDKSQSWTYSKITSPDGKESGYALKSAANSNLMINKDSSNGNAILWYVSSGFNDSVMTRTYDSGYIFKLTKHVQGYMTAMGNSNGSFVRFGSKPANTSSSHKWKLL